MSFLDRHPAFKKALANQYQVILVGGAVAASALLANPLPVLLLLGAELVTLPWIVERLKHRIELERKIAGRNARAVTQEEQYRELPQPSRDRFVRLKQACEKIQSNYRSLAPETQGVMADQGEKLEAILVSCLRRLWLLRKHDELGASIDEASIEAHIAELAAQLESRKMSEREREAWSQNLDIKRRVLETARKNQSTRATLVAELDSIEALLQLLLQKSLAAGDAEAFAAEVDDALSQAESDERTVQEMEQMVGAEPMASRERLSDSLRSLTPPQLPPRGRMRS